MSDVMKEMFTVIGGLILGLMVVCAFILGSVHFYYTYTYPKIPHTAERCP